MESGERVEVRVKPRNDADIRPGMRGTITVGEAESLVYIVVLDDGREVWMTREDIGPITQLTIDDALKGFCKTFGCPWPLWSHAPDCPKHNYNTPL